MSAHVLLNLLNKFNKFNNTRAQILDSIYHLTLRILSNLISGVKEKLHDVRFCHYVSNLVMNVISIS